MKTFGYLSLLCLLSLPSCKCSSERKDKSSSTEEAAKVSFEDRVVGTGATADGAKKVTVHYVGTLRDGKIFDSSRERQEPVSFVLGTGRVIEGMEKGLIGMKVGGQRHIMVPPNLAYKNQNVGGLIPPNSTLIFDVELLDVQ